jgi:hypothetical protein
MGREQALSLLFGELVERNFHDFAYLEDPGVKAYVTELLLDFVQAENFYRIRDAGERPLEDVGEMLIQSNPLLDAPSFGRERDVRKHIGDFTLFFSGMFPESIGKWRMRSLRLDSFVDYVKAGKESYHIVAEFNQLDSPGTAPLFERLSEGFERCVFGLNMVRRDLDIGQPRVVNQARDIIM